MSTAEFDDVGGRDDRILKTDVAAMVGALTTRVPNSLVRQSSDRARTISGGWRG